MWVWFSLCVCDPQYCLWSCGGQFSETFDSSHRQMSLGVPALNQAKWIFRRNKLLKSVSWCTKTQACWYICCIIFSFYWNTSGLKRVIKLKKKKEKKNLASVGILFVFSSVFKVCFLPSFNMLSKDCTAVSFSVVKEGAQCSLSLSCVCLWFLQDDAKMPDLPWQSLPQNQSLGHDALPPRLLFSGKPEANGKVNPMNIG